MKAGTRAISVAAPTLWNYCRASAKLEGHIVSFRRRLKHISLMLPTLLTFLAPPSICRRLAHCHTIARLLIHLVLSRHCHWAWFSRELAH